MYCMAPPCTALHGNALYLTDRHFSVIYICIALHMTALHCTVQFRTSIHSQTGKCVGGVSALTNYKKKVF